MWKWYSDVEWTGEWNHTCLWKNEHERRGSRDFGTEMTLFLFCFKKYFQGPFAVETRLVTHQSIALESLYQRSFQSNSIRSRVWPETRENLEKKNEGATPQNSIFVSWRPNDLIFSRTFKLTCYSWSSAIERYKFLVITQPATLPVCW